MLVAATDGVGTKVKIAIETGVHDTIGIDLVAMSVNDLVVQGAEPLFFLDYFACGKLDAGGRRARSSRASPRAAGEAGCALIGGETAEMPGLYAGGDYDLAGFAVGAVERGALLPRADIAAGDVVLGLASSGVHSNGFSLVRKVVRDSGLALGRAGAVRPGAHARRGAADADPHLREVVPRGDPRDRRVKALAHITGGGFPDNIPRVLPKGLGAAHRSRARAGAAGVPLARARPAASPRREMLRTFNCGIGMVAVVDARRADAVAAAFCARRRDAWCGSAAWCRSRRARRAVSYSRALDLAR